MSLRSIVDRFFAQSRSWLRSVVRRNRLEAEMEAELAFHLEQLTADLIRAGHAPAEAARRARIELGAVTVHKEAMRASLGLRLWDDLRADVRYALRTMAKDPGFTAVAALTLALGIGVNTAVFSVAEAALLRSWPAWEPERLVQIVFKTPQGAGDSISYPDFRDLCGQSRSLEEALAYARHAKILLLGSETRFVLDDVVSPNYFTVLGIQPEIGRTFGPENRTSGERTVVIGDSLWRSAFNADPSMVGKQIWLTGQSYTVIGVAPPHFRGLARGAPTELWVSAPSEYPTQALADRNDREFEVLGRLRPGTTAAQAQIELDTIGHRLAEMYPANDKARDIVLVSEQERLRQALAPALLLMAAVGIVLLICCANIAGLVLARSERRRGEIAVRLALGAGRFRLVRQLLTESALLAATGAALGLLLAYWLVGLQSALLPPAEVSLGLDLRLDAPVLGYAAAITALAMLLFGFAPSLQAARTSLVPALKSDERAGRPVRRFTARNALVLGETALSVVLLTASGLVARSLIYSQRTNLGFDKQRSLVFLDVTPGIAGYDTERSRAFFQEAEARVASLPGVKRVSFARRVLLSDSGGGLAKRVAIPGVELPQGQLNIPIKFDSVAPSYFKTFGTQLLEGRDFTSADNSTGATVAIVNRTMASRFWPEKDAVGRHIVVEGKDCQVVGVVEDAKINTVHEAPEPYIYLSFAQFPSEEGTILAEIAGPTSSLAPAMRDAVRSLDQRLPVGVRTMHYLMQQAFWADRMSAGFIGALGLVGIFLGAVGLYGVLAYVVNRRRREIGIRIALGAGRKDVLRLVFGQGLRLAAIGTALGLVASYAAMRLLSDLLYGVRPTDPLVFVCSTVVVILVALAASWLPARRAASVQPMQALRHE